MEPRKITIANTRDQKKTVVMSAATTLGELKRDLDEAGVNYYDMDFIEALTKTQLKDDASVLPHDVPFNHTTTNELVFLLTTPNRKIKSGMERSEVYELINNADDSDGLKELIKQHFGVNYTMVKTVDLETFLDMQHPASPSHDEDEHCCPACQTADERINSLEKKVANLTEAMMELIDILDDDYFTEDIYNALVANAKPKDRTVYSAGMNAEQIDALVADVRG